MTDETGIWGSEEDEADAASAEAIARRQREFEEEQSLRTVFRDHGDSGPLNEGAYESDRPKRTAPMVPCFCGESDCDGERPDPKAERIGESILQPSVTPDGGSSSKGRRRHEPRPPNASDLRRSHDAETAYRTDYGSRP